MAFGVLEIGTEAHVAGTIPLYDKSSNSESDTTNFKHGIGSNAHIVLAPQPSEDPNDPLNWSFLTKHAILVILCFGSVVNAAAVGPMIAAGTVQIAMELPASLTDVALLSGYLLLTAGASGPILSALARKYGKRPIYVYSSLMSLVGCIIGEVAKDYKTFLAARIIQGLGVPAYESLIVSSMGDIFFVHERGSRTAIVMFILTAISSGVGLIAGPITANLGWSYNFHILLPFTALQFILLVLFVPETAYRRKHLYEIDIQGSEEEWKKLGNVEQKVNHEQRVEGEHLETTDSNISSIPAKKTFVQRMALYNGVIVRDSVFKMLLACPVILLNLGALYNVVVSGVVITWFVALSVLSSLFFTIPPYSLTAAGVGYTFTGPLIGGTLSLLILGPVSDPFVTWLAQKNKGIYEPEFRLPVMIPGLVTTVAGLVGFGYAIQNQVSVYLASFIWGVMMFGMTTVASVTTSYALDAFREHSTEMFIMNMVFKNFFFYGLTKYVIDWYLTQGVVKMFNIMAGVSAAVIAMTLPMYIFGKKYRYYWQHHNLIKTFHLETDKTGAEE